MVKEIKNKKWNETKTNDSWSIFKIMGEFVEGYEKLSAIGPCISIFGSARTNPDEKIVSTVCESTKKIFGDYVLNISNAGTGPMYAFTNILSVPCISVGASYIFCRMHSPNEFAKIDLLNKTTKNICLLLENFSRS